MQDMELEKEDSFLILELVSLTISSLGSLRKFIDLYLTQKGKKMSNYNSLKTTIDANIKQNGRQEITGQILNSVLNQMVTTLGAGYQFARVATTATNPGTPDAKVFYIANGKGTYTHFNNIEVTEDEVVVLYWDSSWHKVSTGIASNSKLTALFNDVAALERDLGQYAELPSVSMTAETTGKYINADGEFVDDADFNIAAIGAVVVGNTYELYMGSAANMKLGVALFVARIKTTTTSGTERIEYVPLFSAMSTDIPTSGYVCFEAMDAYSDVLVCYRSDVPEAATLLVRRYGTKASIATQINNLRKKVDLKSFADGYYESMRVGTADNLTSKGDATEEVIMSRKAGGDNQIEDGSASIKRIKGYSVVMNQLASLSSGKREVNGITYDVQSSGDIHIYGTASANAYLSAGSAVNKKGHSLLIYGIPSTGTSNNTCYSYCTGDVNIQDNGKGAIGLSKTNAATYYIVGYVKAGQTVDITIRIGFIDLTQMFGFGNEPTTPEDFAKRLGYSSIDDVPYIPYNEGEIVSSFAEGIKTTDTEGKVSERKWSETLKKCFPDGLKSAGSAFDEITPTKAVKRIGEIDLGTLAWDKTSANGKTYYHTKEAIPNRSANSYVVTSCYTTENRYPSQIQESESIDRVIGYKGYFTGVELWVIDSRYDTPEAFAAAMSGVLLYYVLATPEETAYDELNLTEQVAEGGTEEAIITEGKTSTPLRADIVYPIDAYNTIKANKANIGTLSSLNTASKTDLVSAINELAGKVAALEANATEVTNETTE